MRGPLHEDRWSELYKKYDLWVEIIISDPFKQPINPSTSKLLSDLIFTYLIFFNFWPVPSIIRQINVQEGRYQILKTPTSHIPQIIFR